LRASDHVLIKKGCVENDELLALAQSRADAEEAYGVRLQELARSAVRKGGFARDDGASARKAFDGMRKEMEEVSRNVSQLLRTGR